MISGCFEEMADHKSFTIATNVPRSQVKERRSS